MVKCRYNPSKANRGMGFERVVEAANAAYLAKGWGVIQKVATPWKVLRRGAQIVSAFPEGKSTVDFVGAAAGKAIAFDAKSCKQDRFPLANIEPHQIEFLRRWEQQGGIAFLLIEMKNHERVWLARLDRLEPFLERAKTGKRGTQSLTIEDMIDHFAPVQQGRGVVLDYLAHIVSGEEDKTREESAV